MLSGHSAGAHLALLLSYASAKEFKGDYEFDDNFIVKAVVAMSPPTILYDNNTNNLRDLSDVFKNCDTIDERKKTSPISYVTDNSPPTLLCVGTSDYIVFPTSSERLYEKLKEKKVLCKLILSVGGGHSFEKIHSFVEPSIGMSEMQNALVKFILQNIEK